MYPFTIVTNIPFYTASISALRSSIRVDRGKAGADPEGEFSIQQAQVQTDGGYILEIFVPVDLLGGSALVDGATFGVNVSLSDADSSVLGQETMLSTSPTRTYDNPTTFGKITLVK